MQGIFFVLSLFVFFLKVIQDKLGEHTFSFVQSFNWTRVQGIFFVATLIVSFVSENESN